LESHGTKGIEPGDERAQAIAVPAGLAGEFAADFRERAEELAVGKKPLSRAPVGRAALPDSAERADRARQLSCGAYMLAADARRRAADAADSCGELVRAKRHRELAAADEARAAALG
jgi:hypothetical protein